MTAVLTSSQLLWALSFCLRGPRSQILAAVAATKIGEIFGVRNMAVPICDGGGQPAAARQMRAA